MAGPDKQMTPPPRNYGWYQYESRKTTPFEAFWMAVFTVALVVGFPVGFAALFLYAIPWLGRLW